MTLVVDWDVKPSNKQTNKTAIQRDQIYSSLSEASSSSIDYSMCVNSEGSGETPDAQAHLSLCCLPVDKHP